MPHINTKPGEIDHTVEVFIVFGDRVLIRKHDKYKHWLGVGGHIELDEDANQAAIREVKEEVGLDISLYSLHPLADKNETLGIELVPPMFLNRHEITDIHSHVSYIFLARSTSDIVIPEKESDEWKWLTRKEVKDNRIGMMPNVQHYALVALDALGINN